MADQSMIAQSKREFTISGGGNPTHQEINTGCAQRQALAAEQQARATERCASALESIARVLVNHSWTERQRVRGQIRRIQKRLGTLEKGKP